MKNFLGRALFRALRSLLVRKSFATICVLTPVFVVSIEIGYAAVLAALGAAIAEFVRWFRTLSPEELEHKLRELLFREGDDD